MREFSFLPSSSRGHATGTCFFCSANYCLGFNIYTGGWLVFCDRGFRRKNPPINGKPIAFRGRHAEEESLALKEALSSANSRLAKLDSLEADVESRAREIQVDMPATILVRQEDHSSSSTSCRTPCLGFFYVGGTFHDICSWWYVGNQPTEFTIDSGVQV